MRSSPSTITARTRAARCSQGIVHGASVTCPLHNWVISLETGKALGADEGEVKTISLRNDDGHLSILLDDRQLVAAE